MTPAQPLSNARLGHRENIFIVFRLSKCCIHNKRLTIVVPSLSTRGYIGLPVDYRPGRVRFTYMKRPLACGSIKEAMGSGMREPDVRARNSFDAARWAVGVTQRFEKMASNVTSYCFKEQEIIRDELEGMDMSESQGNFKPMGEKGWCVTMSGE